MKNDKILLYYGFEEGECGIYHAFEAVDPEAPGDDGGIADRLAELLDCKAGDDRFDYNSMLIQLPASLVERIEAKAVQKHLKASKEITKGEKVYAHAEAADIIEVFEDVPSAEDDERGSDSGCLYGSTYDGLLDAVETILIEMASRVKNGAEIIEDVFP